MFSPDGKWVAFLSDESGRSEVYVRSFPDPTSRVQVSAEGAQEIQWSDDGRKLYYRSGGELLAAKIELAQGFRVMNRDTVMTTAFPAASILRCQLRRRARWPRDLPAVQSRQLPADHLAQLDHRVPREDCGERTERSPLDRPRCPVEYQAERDRDELGLLEAERSLVVSRGAHPRFKEPADAAEPEPDIRRRHRT